MSAEVYPVSNHTLTVTATHPPNQNGVLYHPGKDNEEHKKLVIQLKKLINEDERTPVLLIHHPLDRGSDDEWVKRDPRLIRITGTHTYNAEPPLSLITKHFITPRTLHYVRSHGPVPRINGETWTIEVTGLVKNKRTFTMYDLEHNFKSIEFPVTFACCGNRRMEENMVKVGKGFDWGAGAISTNLWRGVPLVDILNECGIMSPEEGAKHVYFLGGDSPAEGAYGASIHRELAMDPANDIILAFKQNGHVLTPDHGYPVRVIVPGYIGGRMVKWLKRIEVISAETDNYYQVHDNKVFPPYVDAKIADAEDWWHKPDCTIYPLNINSVITSPVHDEILYRSEWTPEQRYSLKGFAHSGGGKKVIRVEVTLDEGNTWLVANLQHMDENGTRYGKHWCWVFWSLEVQVIQLLEAKEIAVRAWDETFNTQHQKLIWDLMGMMNNCWFRIKTYFFSTEDGKMGIKFKHPTNPGDANPGGWMYDENQPNNNQVQKPTKYFFQEEVDRHTVAVSCWVTYHFHVYNVSEWLDYHPGGKDIIMKHAGGDVSKMLDGHSAKARTRLETYRIGELIERNICTIISKETISGNVRKFRFDLPETHPIQEPVRLLMPVGKHIGIYAIINDEVYERSYTPVKIGNGYFELVVKIYPNGPMSQYLDSLENGSKVVVDSPLGFIEYTGHGKFEHLGKPIYANKLAMVAYGSGLMPIYGLMQAILNDEDDKTEMFLVYANQSEDDIMMRAELDEWAEKYKERVKVWYVVGDVTDKILRDHLPEAGDDVLALGCMPDEKIKLTGVFLKNMGYDIEQRFLIFH